ncbi:hypothetical protein [Nostoc sp. MS1]|uniref:hypothetical protein n=1 Tax=Nostoc sp. MS1 TaxID=2764711 RepID=UPI001CC7E9B6|nr:hypothetical protein [Nostoc sp. MS1]
MNCVFTHIKQTFLNWDALCAITLPTLERESLPTYCSYQVAVKDSNLGWEWGVGSRE